MAEADHLGFSEAEAEVESHFDSAVEIASLREQGGDRVDPVRFRYLETLAERALQHRGEVRRILDAKLAKALAIYRERFEQAQGEAKAAIARIAAQRPEAADDLQRLLLAGDFRGIGRLLGPLEENEHRPSLAELTRYIAQHSPEDVVAGVEEDVGARSDLKTMRHFRNTWSTLSVEKQVAEAIEQAPENAGPINSHMLVLRSLGLMRDISPDYLKRFMSYLDTLLWLDQVDEQTKPPPKKPLPAKAGKRSG